MEITRIDRDRTVIIPCDRIELTVADNKFILTEEFFKLRVHAQEGGLIIKPAVSNEITIDIDKD